MDHLKCVFSGRDSSHHNKLCAPKVGLVTGAKSHKGQSPGQAETLQASTEIPSGTRRPDSAPSQGETMGMFSGLSGARRRRRARPLLTHTSNWEFSSGDFSCDAAPRARSGSAPSWVKALQTSSHTVGIAFMAGFGGLSLTSLTMDSYIFWAVLNASCERAFYPPA